MLSQDQIVRDIQTAYMSGAFALEEEVKKLVASEVDEKVARYLVTKTVKELNGELSVQKQTPKTDEETAKVMRGVILGAAVIGPIFQIDLFMWYVMAAVAAGACGYFGYKHKPFAGLLGAVCMVIVCPYTYDLYFSGRDFIIQIEYVIPILMALIPAFIVYLIVSRVFYPKIED